MKWVFPRILTNSPERVDLMQSFLCVTLSHWISMFFGCSIQMFDFASSYTSLIHEMQNVRALNSYDFLIHTFCRIPRSEKTLNGRFNDSDATYHCQANSCLQLLRMPWVHYYHYPIYGSFGKVSKKGSGFSRSTTKWGMPKKWLLPWNHRGSFRGLISGYLKRRS